MQNGTEDDLNQLENNMFQAIATTLNLFYLDFTAGKSKASNWTS